MNGRNEKGITFPELLIVTAILMVVAAFLFPVFANMHNYGPHPMGELNIRQISYGLIQYMQDNEEKGPRAGFDCLDHASDPSVFKKGEQNQCGGDGWQDVVAPYIKSKSVFVSPTDKSEVGDGPWGAGTDTHFTTTDGNFSELYNDLLAHKMPDKSGGYADPAKQDKRADGIPLTDIKDPKECLMLAEGHGGWDRCSTKTEPVLIRTDWTGSTDLQNKWHHDYTISSNYTGFMSATDYSGVVTISKGLPFNNKGGNVAFIDGHQAFKLYSTAKGLPELCKSLPWTGMLDPERRNSNKDSCRDPDNPVPAGWGGSNWF